MATRIFFKHQSTGKEFTVLGFDREKGTVKLQGEHSTIEEPFDKEKFVRMGYTLQQEEVADASTAA